MGLLDSEVQRFSEGEADRLEVIGSKHGKTVDGAVGVGMGPAGGGWGWVEPVGEGEKERREGDHMRVEGPD